jgi:hypothetical protein
MGRGAKMNYWEEVLDKTKATRFGVMEREIVSYKKCVNRSYGQIWFEVELVDGRVLTSNMAGH